MDYAPTKAGFPPQRRVRKEYAEQVQFPLCGRAPKGLWTRKLEFLVEVLHEHPPTAICEAAAANYPFICESEITAAHEETPLRRQAFNLTKVRTHDYFPVPVLWGKDVSLSVLSGKPNPFIRIRHADAHTLCFVHRGRGGVNTDFGELRFDEGDFIVLPRGTTYAFDAPQPITILIYEFTKRLMAPHHHWIPGYPFAHTVIMPAEPKRIYFDSPENGDTWPVYVKRHTGRWTILRYPFSPFDAVAWEGELYPFVLQLKDIRTLSSPDFHLDPTASTVFVTEDENASVQVFKPRRLHSLPYNHQNYVTEVLFNHGSYEARPAMGQGVATLHPPGTAHGPDILALHTYEEEHEATAEKQPWSAGVAVMLETKSPLIVLRSAKAVELLDYETSWWQQYQKLKIKGGENVRE